MRMWEDTYGKERQPTPDEVEAFVGSPCWKSLSNHIESHYGSKASMHYSGCSMQRGWNVKYRKSGRALCTLYPMDGWFYALVVLGNMALEHANAIKDSFAPPVQALLAQKQSMQNQQWLMVEVHGNEDVADVMSLLKLRTQYQ